MTGIYQTDREWSDKIIPQIKAIVGPRLLVESPLDLDREQATDLFLFTARDMKIAARVRRPGYLEKYPFDFTLRSQRDNGSTTELSKIIDGFGDWLFYGHCNESDAIVSWWLIDLHSFRSALIRHKRIDGVHLAINSKCNGDGTHFVAYDLRSFPSRPSILIASSHPLPTFELEVAS